LDFTQKENTVPLQIVLDSDSVVPLYVQLRSRLEYMIGTGFLPSGTQLPSVRELAGQLQIAPTTVQQAYKDLQQKNLLETQRGRGTFVPQLGTQFHKNKELMKPHKMIDTVLFDTVITQSIKQGFSFDDIREAFEERITLRERGIQIVFIGISDAMHKYESLIQASLAGLNAMVSSISIEELRASPKLAQELLSEFDLCVTLLFHFREIQDITAGLSIKSLSLISELSNQTLESLTLLPVDTKIGLVCRDTSFNNYQVIIQRYCPPDQEVLYSDPNDKEAFAYLIKKVSVILHTTVLKDFVQKSASSDIKLIELMHVPNSDSLAKVREYIKATLGK